MPKTHNVHDDVEVDFVRIREKVDADNLKWSAVRDGWFEAPLQKLQDLGPHIHKFKSSIFEETGVRRKVVYSKELGFHHIEPTGVIWVFLPQSFVLGQMEEIGIEEFKRHHPGITQQLQNIPSKDGFAATVALNHTGNHYRNKHIKVAVQPGQPVRG